MQEPQDIQEQSQAEIVPESLPGPAYDPLPPPVPESPPEDPETWPIPSPLPEPEQAPEPVPTATRRPLQLPPEQWQAAMQIANALGETEPVPRGQIVRAVRVLGLDRVRAFFDQAQQIEAAGGMMLPDGSRRRSPGGVFFYLVRNGIDKADRWKVFLPPSRPRSERQGQGQPDQPTAQPAPAAAPPAPPATPIAVITEIPNATGETRTVKITLIGRPGRIISKPGYVLTTMTSSKVPPLPKGMPTPPAKPTTYTVYISHKHWQKVAASLQANAEDVLIVEGTPAYDPDLEGIAVFVTNASTKLLQQAQRAAQSGA